MAKDNKTQRKGRPKEWTDKELKQLALDIKFKLNGKKLTPSLLEKETKVGRNTWTRRMKDYIDELNAPVVSSVSLDGRNEAILPSIDLIFEKYGNDKISLKNELLNLEILLYDLYKQLKDYKEKEEHFESGLAVIQELKDDLKKQRKRALHYEQLYNNIVVSSVFSHLQGEKRSQVNELNLKEKLINMEDSIDNSTKLENLSSYFPDIKDVTNESENQNQNMQKLLNKFDV
ncbi:hypothetical protein [Sporosarcina ureae]|uniref:hypothetical protein n=1 Tax=Sporosarcina ureae TaxID=1571 RepID=UPI000A17C20E|nr:hypothetical protein [Sporosarcina ureae]ARK21864.1 hypothetical protein SporoP32a_10215 [Sporosarcina ureae]